MEDLAGLELRILRDLGDPFELVLHLTASVVGALVLEVVGVHGSIKLGLSHALSFIDLLLLEKTLLLELLEKHLVVMLGLVLLLILLRHLVLRILLVTGRGVNLMKVIFVKLD